MNFPMMNPGQIQYDSTEIPKTIDSLMNAYMGMQKLDIQKQELGMNQQKFAGERNAAMLQNGGVDLTSTTPAQITEASKDGGVGALHDLVTRYKASQQMGVQQAQAGLQKTQSDIGKVQSETDLNKFWTGAMTQGGGDVGNGLSAMQKSWRDDVASGRKTPEQAYTEASRVGPNGIGKFIVDNALAGLDVAGLQRQDAEKRTKMNATASYEGGPNVQNPVRLIESAKPIYAELHSLAEQMGFGKYPLINKARLEYLQQTGDPTASKYIAKREEGNAQTAQIFQAGGSPTDVAQKRADKFLPEAPGIDQLKQLTSGDSSTIAELLGMRGAALQGKPQPKAQVSSPQEQGGSVRVVRYDGKTGTIPKAQLKEALKSGYKLAGN